MLSEKNLFLNLILCCCIIFEYIEYFTHQSINLSKCQVNQSLSLSYTIKHIPTQWECNWRFHALLLLTETFTRAQTFT